MKVNIIGCGASGVYSALLIKKFNPLIEVNIFDANEKVLAKVKASGNGKCNINNLLDDSGVYNDSAFIQEVFKKHDIKEQLEVLKSFGIYVKELMPNYLYPFSESSGNVRNILLKDIKDLGINLYTAKELINYEIKNSKITCSFKDGSTSVSDKLIIATGTSASLKEDITKHLDQLLLNKGYKFVNRKSALCPLIVKENVSSLFGSRVKCQINAYASKKLIYSSFGEVMFKKDALSGIVIFNLASVISRNNYQDVKISLKLLDDDLILELKSLLKEKDDALYSFFNKELADYIYKISRNDFKDIIKNVSNLEFNYLKLYPKSSSQVLSGGLELCNLTTNLESKIEPNVYFIGEMLNIDGFCGGFNLKWALTSALTVLDNFIQK